MKPFVITELHFNMPGQPLLLHLIKSQQRWEPRVKDYPDLKVLSGPPALGGHVEIYIFKVVMHQIVLEIIQPQVTFTRGREIYLNCNAPLNHGKPAGFQTRTQSHCRERGLSPPLFHATLLPVSMSFMRIRGKQRVFPKGK